MRDNYFSNIRNEMTEYVPESATKILEVGCGKGIFGEQILKRQKAEYWGVEPNTFSAQLAQKKLFKVLNNLFTDSLDIPHNYFDCIIFNDVLEHIHSPEQALSFSKNLLAKSERSCIVASIPNFRYIKNIYHLLVEKDFKYEESGIRDKTHLHFFTKKSIERFFIENDFTIKKMTGINPSKKILFSLLNLILLNSIEDMKFSQYAVIASPVT